MDKNKKEAPKKKKKLPKDELIKFLRRNQGKYTLSDLVTQTGWTWNTIKTICNNNKIEIVDQLTRAERLIKANLHLDIDDMAALLKIGVPGVRFHLKRLDITLPRETIVKVEPAKTPERTIKELKETDLLGPIAKSYQEGSFIDLWNKLRYG